jgi:hypothetical protein
MKRWLVTLLIAGVASQSAWSQGTRQVTAPAREIEDAAAQLVQLNASQGRMMETNKKMAEIHSALNERITAVCKAGNNRVSPADAAKALSDLCGMAINSNLQFLALQTQMQNENRQFTAISNIMKTRHDTVKNSISNIR